MATTSPQSQSTIRQEVAATLKRLEAKDPGLKQLLKKAYGYAVFPTVGKAALVVGGAYGKGAVFEQGKFIGYATIGQTTIGVQIGGNTFTEVVAFENKQALERFKQGKVKFAANAAAVLVKAGAAGTADYEKGVQALAYSRGGMLLEAAIGGQKFGFKPAGGAGGEEGGKQGQKGGKQGEKGSKGSKASRQTQEDQEEQDQSDEGDEPDDGDESASSGSGMLKGHPVMTTLIGTGIVAGIAILAVRALRQSLGGESSAEEGSEEAGDEDQEQDEDSDARMQNEEDDQDEEGQEEDQRDESEEDEEEDTETQGRSEDEGEEEEEGDEEEQQEPPRRSSRFASRR